MHRRTTGGTLPPRGQPSVSNGLSSFGILLTGRLERRNELLSALSLGKVGVWDERYFVLTRKGLHFYVPPPVSRAQDQCCRLARTRRRLIWPRLAEAPGSLMTQLQAASGGPADHRGVATLPQP